MEGRSFILLFGYNITSFIQKTMCTAQNIYYFMQYIVIDALCDQYL